MKTNKKGFTIVELTIVIAVIAILAAVLIPTFVSLVKKANNSADVQMVTNINKYLASIEAIDGKNETMADAMADAADAGYTSGAFKSAKNTILWSEKTDRFLAVNENGRIIISAENEELPAGAKFWIVSETVHESYSTYLIGSETISGDIKNGLDLTEYGPASITYSGDDDTILNGTFTQLTVSQYCTPTVYGYVQELTGAGSVKSVDAHFHQEKDSIGTKVEGNAVFGDHVWGANDTCLYCDKQKHEHQTAESVTAASCTSIGFKIAKCECGYTELEVIPALGHTWTVVNEGTPATCETPGHGDKKQCSVCNVFGGYEYIPSIGHDWDNEGICKNCNKNKGDVLQKLSQEKINSATTSFVNQYGSGYFELEEDITITATQFQQLLTLPNSFSVDDGFDEAGNVKTIEISDDNMEHVEIDLNGHTLTISGVIDDNSFRMVYWGVLGKLKISNGTLIRKESDGINLFYLAEEGASIIFENMTVHTTYSPVYVYDKNQTVVVNNSSLKLYGDYEFNRYYKGWYGFVFETEYAGFTAKGDSLTNVEIITD